MDSTLLKTIADLGVPTAVLAVILWFWTRQQSAAQAIQKDMSEQMVNVVRNNTEALTKLCGSSEDTSTALQAHDVRAQRIEQNVGQIMRATDRIEQRVERLKPEKT